VARMGRRPGGGDTRAEVLLAARRQFATKGYRGATIRGIAAAAEVDPALVHHYFGTKRQLFVAAVEFPIDPAQVVAAAAAGTPDGVGERIARTLLQLWGTDEGRTTMQSMLRSALSDDDLLGVLREFILETVLLPLVDRFSPDRRPLRATLLASQIMGLAMARYVAKLEPLASADEETVIAWVGPTLQRYLVEDLTEGQRAPSSPLEPHTPFLNER
jgi:AcrR family transcriptional regulator